MRSDRRLYSSVFVHMSGIHISCLLMTIALVASTYASSIPLDHDLVGHMGRTVINEQKHLILGYSGCCMSVAFESRSISIKMRSIDGHNSAIAYLDGKRLCKIEVAADWAQYQITDNLGPGLHTLEIVKATEGSQGNIEISKILLSKDGSLQPWPGTSAHRIEFIGDSITCGFGIEADSKHDSWDPSTENFCDTYAFLTARALEADYLVVAVSGIGMLRNYNGPRTGSENNMPQIYSRTFFHDQSINWDFSRFTPEIVCINLGTNDFSTTGVDPDLFETQYQTFVTRLLDQYPSAHIVLLLGPMLNSPDVKSILQRIVDTAIKCIGSPRVSLFEMSPQGTLGYGASGHPSKLQARKNATELTAYLRLLIDKWDLNGES